MAAARLDVLWVQQGYRVKCSGVRVVVFRHPFRSRSRSVPSRPVPTPPPPGSISPIWLGARISHLGAARSSAHTLKPEIFLTTHQRHFLPWDSGMWCDDWAGAMGHTTTSHRLLGGTFGSACAVRRGEDISALTCTSVVPLRDVSSGCCSVGQALPHLLLFTTYYFVLPPSNPCPHRLPATVATNTPAARQIAYWTASCTLALARAPDDFDLLQSAPAPGTALRPSGLPQCPTGAFSTLLTLAPGKPPLKEVSKVARAVTLGELPSSRLYGHAIHVRWYLLHLHLCLRSTARHLATSATSLLNTTVSC